MIDQRLERTCRPPADSLTPAGPRIFVFGCARSGTTLLLNLFRTFTTATVLDGEHCSTDLREHPGDQTVIAKRTPHCAEHLLTDLPHLKPLWIIDVVRDPRDVITSRLAPWPSYYCGFERWARDTATTAALRGRHLRLLHLRYEDLLDHPDAIQADLADILGLTPATRFSDWPQGLPADLSAQARSALGGLRPLTPDRAGRWRHDPQHRARIRAQLQEHTSMELLLRAAGYPPTDLQASDE